MSVSQVRQTFGCDSAVDFDGVGAHLSKLVQVGHAAQHQQHRLVLTLPRFVLLSNDQVFEKSPEKVKNFGICG